MSTGRDTRPQNVGKYCAIAGRYGCMERNSCWADYREIAKRLSKRKIKWRSCGYAVFGLLFGFAGELDMYANFCEGHSMSRCCRDWQGTRTATEYRHATL